jgi:hypothetical protein
VISTNEGTRSQQQNQRHIVQVLEEETIAMRDEIAANIHHNECHVNQLQFIKREISITFSCAR